MFVFTKFEIRVGIFKCNPAPHNLDSSSLGNTILIAQELEARSFALQVGPFAVVAEVEMVRKCTNAQYYAQTSKHPPAKTLITAAKNRAAPDDDEIIPI